jgi:hypothetical protein
MWERYQGARQRRGHGPTENASAETGAPWAGECRSVTGATLWLGRLALALAVTEIEPTQYAKRLAPKREEVRVACLKPTYEEREIGS